MLIVGFITGFGQFLRMGLFNIFADNISLNMKLRYFRSALEKDAAYYDLHNQNEIASKISKECSAVQNGLGSKVGEIIGKSLGVFLSFTVAFIYCSEFTLLLIAFFPVLAFSAVYYGILMKKGMAEGMKKYAQSAGYAEQAL